VRTEQLTYPPIVTHYNIYPAIKVQASPAPGYSTGQAMQAIEEVAAQALQPGFGYEWTGTAFQEQSSSGAASIIFGLAFVIVFLVRAAQYESYTKSGCQSPLIIKKRTIWSQGCQRKHI
jgi:multidrug efflux pump subunit AcrB